MNRAWRRPLPAQTTPPSKPPARNARRVAGLSLLVAGALGVWWWSSSSAPDPAPLAVSSDLSPKNEGLKVKRTASIRIGPTGAPQPTPQSQQPLSAPISMMAPAQGEPAPELEQPPSPPKRVLVTVIDSRGQLIPDAIVESEDCRIFQMTDNGRAEIMVVEDACTFQAGRRDGALMAWSDPVFLDLTARSEATARLEVSAERTAGMGLQVIPGEGGILVRGVVPGSPAERAGVLMGDLITAVDGVSTLDLSVREFIELGTGPVGSRVSISIMRATEAAKVGMDFTLIRQPIEQAP